MVLAKSVLLASYHVPTVSIWIDSGINKDSLVCAQWVHDAMHVLSYYFDLSKWHWQTKLTQNSYVLHARLCTLSNNKINNN